MQIQANMAALTAACAQAICPSGLRGELELGFELGLDGSLPFSERLLWPVSRRILQWGLLQRWSPGLRLLAMALKFLNKKGWHTGSLRNIETVWKAEQKHEAEQKKLEELKKQINDEREASEFRLLQEQAGLAP